MKTMKTMKTNMMNVVKNVFVITLIFLYSCNPIESIDDNSQFESSIDVDNFFVSKQSAGDSSQACDLILNNENDGILMYANDSTEYMYQVKIFYTDHHLTEPYMGSDNWYKVKIKLQTYIAQISIDGQVIKYGEINEYNKCDTIYQTKPLYDYSVISTKPNQVLIQNFTEGSSGYYQVGITTYATKADAKSNSVFEPDSLDFDSFKIYDNVPSGTRYIAVKNTSNPEYIIIKSIDVKSAPMDTTIIHKNDVLLGYDSSSCAIACSNYTNHDNPITDLYSMDSSTFESCTHLYIHGTTDFAPSGVYSDGEFCRTWEVIYGQGVHFKLTENCSNNE